MRKPDFKRSRRHRGERGQILIIFAMLIVPITFAVGVVAVDASMWQSERRGAQKDADHAALAGALQLVFEQNEANAENAAIDYANNNDEAGNADEPVRSDSEGLENTVVANDSCFPSDPILPLNTVSVNLNHDTRTLFASTFGFELAPDVGAHAKACVGSITNPVGLRPFIFDIQTSLCFTEVGGDRVPDFGSECTMDFGAHTDTDGTDIPGGNRGVADIHVPDGACSDKGSSGDLEELIEFGAGNVRCGTQSGTTCPELPGYPNNTYGICVVGQTGNAQNIIDGVEALLTREGDCDAAYTATPDQAGIDDFSEALELIAGPGGSSPDNVYAPRPCNADGDTSPRLITIFAVDEWLGSNDEMPIRYFVHVYVTGCQPRSAPFNPTCSGNMSPVGQVEIRGIIVKTFTADVGDVGNPNEGGALTISLVE